MDWLIVIAALIVSFLVFTWLLKVVKATISTALAIALVILLLQVVFGIGVEDLWTGIQDVWHQVMEIWVQG